MRWTGTNCVAAGIVLVVQHFTLGRNNGLRVSALSLGTATFGGRWGYGAEPDMARQIFEKFADAGGTFIDTAASYQGGESEEYVRRLVAGRRDQFVVATKYSIGSNQQGTGLLATGSGRRPMFRSVEASLRRLGTDYIDLLWVHFPDRVTPVDETVRALDDLASSGRILYAGLSNFPAWLAARAATLAELRGLIPVAGIQFEYSLLERTADREIFPMAEALGMGATLWSPLGGGVLTGKYRAGQRGRLTEHKRAVRPEVDAQKVAIVDAVLAAAADLGVPPAQVAVAWLLERSRRSPTGVVPIIGPRTPEQMDSYLAALAVELGPEVYRRLEEVSAIDLGEPHTKLIDEGDLARGGANSDFRFHPVPSE
jgi:aryl-alcohol dehydrogenase-like predicted oxidoreductase